MNYEILNYQSYRDFLADVLVERTRRDPSYHLRSFATSLKLSPSMLSSILNGKKSLSYSRAFDVAGHLRLNAEERSYFCDLVDKESTRSPARRKRSETRIKDFQSNRLKDSREKSLHAFEEVEIKTQETMRHWYYWALDELMKMPGEHTLVDLAIKLNLPLASVRQALGCLMHLGIIHKNKNNTYSRTNRTITTSVDVPNKVIAGLHKEVLQKATEAIDSQSIENRDYSAIILSIDKKDINAVKKKISDFRRELYAYMDDSRKVKNDVYCMSVQFFSLLQLDERGSHVSND